MYSYQSKILLVMIMKERRVLQIWDITATVAIICSNTFLNKLKLRSYLIPTENCIFLRVNLTIMYVVRGYGGRLPTRRHVFIE